MQTFSPFFKAAAILLLMSGPGVAEDLSSLWSYGLTSVRTGEPLIKDGDQHRIDPAVVRYGYNKAVDASGRTLLPAAVPLHGGEQLVATADYQEDANSREFARIVSIMAPLRDAILYDFEKMDLSDWRNLTETLTLNGIKTTPAASVDRRSILSSEQVWDYVQAGPSDGSAVMRYLEEAGLELKCLAFTDFDFVNPEGADHCAEHGLAVGSGIRLP